MKGGVGVLYEVGLGGIICDTDMQVVNQVNVVRLNKPSYEYSLVIEYH